MTKEGFVLRIAKAGVVGVGVIAALAVSVPGFAGGNKYAASLVTRDCGDNDTVVLNGPAKLWPPNHKFVAEPVTATDGDGSSNVTLTLTPVITDAVGGDGGPQHDPDYTPDGSPAASGAGSATVSLELRAERSGKGEGRTYTINWDATFDNGSKSCSSSDDGQSPFTVTVPHDMRPGNR
jgi:hypothetical protein